MDIHSLQNATVSSIESDTSSCSDCSLDEKPPNEALEGLDFSLSDQINPGNPCQVPQSHNGAYGFVNEPFVSQNSFATSIPNGIHFTQVFFEHGYTKILYILLNIE
jgi:hypothetical protein